jgi:hypothetical protein
MLRGVSRSSSINMEHSKLLLGAQFLVTASGVMKLKQSNRFDYELVVDVYQSLGR